MSGHAQWTIEGSAQHKAMLSEGWEEIARRWVQDAFWSALMVKEER